MIYEATVPNFKKMLTNLSLMLDKGAQFAETKKVDFDVLLNSRLAPDQLNLARQIQIACDSAKLGVSRLTGKEAPAHPDTEKTLAEFKARIKSVVAFLDTFSEKDFHGADARHITQPRWEGKYLNGNEYAFQHAIPNVYFHVTTAYAILRHNGVEIGKKDFLGEMPFKK